MPTQFELGYLAGLLVGEGHFGGDGRQPQVALRMHVRHEAIFRWLERTFPGGRLYGPYHHGGRSYFQWMARGPFLRDELVPLLDRVLSPGLDRHSFDRYQLMKARYPQLAGASRPPVRRTAANGVPANGPATQGDRADDPPASVPPGPGPGAGDHPAPASRSAASSASAREPAPFADLFTELRKTWPPG